MKFVKTAKFITKEINIELEELLKNYQSESTKNNLILFDKKQNEYFFSTPKNLKYNWGVIGKEILEENEVFYSYSNLESEILVIDISSNSTEDISKSTNMRKKYLSNLLKQNDIFNEEADILSIIDIANINGYRENVSDDYLLNLESLINQKITQNNYKFIYLVCMDQKNKWYEYLINKINFTNAFYSDYNSSTNEWNFKINNTLLNVLQEVDNEYNTPDINKQLRRLNNLLLNIFIVQQNLSKQIQLDEYKELLIEQVSLSNTILSKDRNLRFYNFTKTNYTIFSDKFSVRENIVMYESYFGATFDGNPKAIYEKFQEKYSEKYTHVIVVQNINEYVETFKGITNVKLVKFNSLQYIFFLSISKYLVNNVTFPSYFIKKEDQVYLNTWHGISLKNLGNKIQNNYGKDANVTRNFLHSDMIITPSEFSKIPFKNDYNLAASNVEFLEMGYPRNDILLEQEKGVQKIQNILYAPTWRGQSISKEVLEIIVKFGEENPDYNLVVKLHHFDKKEVSKIQKKEYPNVRIAGITEDIQELMIWSDCLISDYSSLIFDYALMQRPILLYTFDLKDYEERRGLIQNIDNYGLPIVTTPEEIVIKIKEEASTLDENHPIFKYSQSFEKSSDKIIEKIINYKPQKLNGFSKKRILIYGGAMIKNGITSSAVNFINTIDKNKYDVYLLSRNTGLDSFVFDQIDEKVNFIFRVSDYNLLPSEFYTYDFSLNYDTDPYKKIHKREVKRLLGDLKFDIAIDFNGYSAFFAKILLNTNTEKKYIYQHNDMFKEIKKIKNGEVLHEKNLNMIFSMYKEFTKIIAVSKGTMENNHKNLSKYYTKQQADHIENYINNEEIFEKVCAENLIGQIKPIVNHMLSSKDELLIQNSIYEKVVDKKRKTLDEDLIFVSLGRIEVEKENMKMLKYIHNLIKEYSNVYYYIIGEGSLSQEVRNYINENGLETNIKMLGHIKNPYPILKLADALLLLSNSEGQPMVILESLVLNKKVIVSKIPGTVDFLKYENVKVYDTFSNAEEIVDFVKTPTSSSFDAKEYNEKIDKKYKNLLEK